MLIWKLGSKFAPAVAPYAGMLSLLAAFQSDGVNSPTAEVWRIIMTATLAVFITLVGVIYKNMIEKQKEQDAELLLAKASFTKEIDEMRINFDRRVEEAEKRRDRLFGAIMSIVLGPSVPNEKASELIKALLDRD